MKPLLIRYSMYFPILSQRDEVVGVIPPPPGITPNFTNPPSRAHALITVQIVCAIISTLFTGLRFYTARFIIRQVRVDDYLIISAWFLALVYSITTSINTQYGFGRHLWDVPFSVFNSNCLKVMAISGTFYVISIMLTKLSILAFFVRFVPLGNLQVIIYITMAIVAIYSLVTSFQWVYACRPLEKYWDLTITGGSCINWLKIGVFSGVMNTITDSIILILPVIILRNLRLPKWQKISIIIVLMTGGFVVVASVVRLKRMVDLVYTTDLTWGSISLSLWT
ncbi:hypothetical protein GQ44DRAFT_665978 [Phaeosphaeriaceae sp. PMI808]|nr:hypothetical protein GQ44DRAFT_665978 [Phaeosphaeriaceae sp. PMI808]